VNELFAGGGSAPQYFDPCSATSQQFINNPEMQGGAGLCATAGLLGGIGAPGSFVQNPGGQLGISLSGNINLQPEEGDTYTVGVVFQSPVKEGIFRRLQGSIDWWAIELSKPILVRDPNEIVADCYNYYGNNPTWDPNHPNCVGLLRLGGDILAIYNLADPNYYFPGVNGGKIKTSGIDVQVAWSVDVEDLGGDPDMGRLDLQVLASHLIEWKLQNADGFPFSDYKGTIAFFGAGLGQTFPEFRMNTRLTYSVDDYSIDVRARYIDSMINRMSVIFPGETEFEGVPSIWYWDVAGSWQIMDNAEFRIGLLNAFDQQPPVYRPNVQSGTDPSTYDVLGRRVFTQINLKF
jgi:outer membrane receptor protein involved in Fe transport